MSRRGEQLLVLLELVAPAEVFGIGVGQSAMSGHGVLCVSLCGRVIPRFLVEFRKLLMDVGKCVDGVDSIGFFGVQGFGDAKRFVQVHCRLIAVASESVDSGESAMDMDPGKFIVAPGADPEEHALDAGCVS